MPIDIMAYKFVALAVMLAEINHCSNNLNLSDTLPIKESNVRASAIFDPGIIGFAGFIDTKLHRFSFSESGQLRFITKFEDKRENESRAEYNERSSQINSLITTNDAYRIATNWLVAIDVDLRKLEREKPPEVKQQLFESPKRGLVPLPIFYVAWGGWRHPVITATISGNGGLISLLQDDISYSRRPASLIKDMDKLLAISDSEFRKYSTLERSNLVVRFAAVSYAIATNTPPGRVVAPLGRNKLQSSGDTNSKTKVINELAH